MTDIHNLPTELQIHLFSYLDTKDLDSIMDTNRYFYWGVNSLWKRRIRKEFNVTLPDSMVISPRMYYQKQLVKERTLYVAVEMALCDVNFRKEFRERQTNDDFLDEFHNAALKNYQLKTREAKQGNFAEHEKKVIELYNQLIIDPTAMKRGLFDLILMDLCHINAIHTIIAIYKNHPELIDLSKLLKYAIESLNINLIKTLITLGVNVNKEIYINIDDTKLYLTPLHFAMILPCAPELTSYMYSLGKQCAIDNRILIDIMNLLLEHGANPEIFPIEEDDQTHEVSKCDVNCKILAERYQEMDFSKLNPGLKEVLDKIKNGLSGDNYRAMGRNS